MDMVLIDAIPFIPYNWNIFSSFAYSYPTTAPVAILATAIVISTTSTSAEIDLLSALSDSLAIVPTTPETSTVEAQPMQTLVPCPPLLLTNQHLTLEIR